MTRAKGKDPFWTSYSDLMTSLFFVMLVMFIICVIKLGKDLKEANATNEQLQNILKLEDQFKVLSNSTSLKYDSIKRMFYAKDLVGIEIFYPNDDKIKPKYYATVDKIGFDLQKILHSLLYNKEFRYQMVIEGYAAIKWDKLKTHTYNADNKEMYELSYRRALALYNRWKFTDKLNFRKYNTEIILAGSGFNGINRDQKVEENNKRFIIQIIPKISRPIIRSIPIHKMRNKISLSKRK